MSCTYVILEPPQASHRPNGGVVVDRIQSNEATQTVLDLMQFQVDAEEVVHKMTILRRWYRFGLNILEDIDSAVLETSLFLLVISFAQPHFVVMMSTMQPFATPSFPNHQKVSVGSLGG